MGLFSKSGKNKQEAAQDSGYYTSADDQAATERARAKRASSADGAANSRRSKDREADDPVLPEKKRARRRLVGAIALALAVAVGLPMLLDSEPKQLASDIDIKIPSKDKPAETAEAAAPAPARAAAAPVAASASLDSREEIVSDVKPSPAAAAPPAVAPVKLDTAKRDADLKAEAKLKADAKAEAIAKNKADAKAENEAKSRQDAEYKQEVERKQAEAKAEAKAKADAERKLADAKAAKPAAENVKPSEDARALAILEGKSAAAKPAAADSGQKFVLQVAALSDQGKVDELRDKLKKAGISSFTQKTPSGEITRVRVGPFSNKEEAEKVRAKLSGMGLNGRLETV
jgi:DedD protein